METFLEKMEKQYTQDLENDEDNFDEEDEENSQMPTTDVPAPVNRQRVARQSTIVQVNTGALEIHLRQIKKQIARHEEELAHPVWMKEISEKLNKIPILERRLEHCQLDVNNLRDINLTPGNSGEFNGDCEIRMDTVKAELESIRMIIRRVDVQNSLEAGLFEKVAGLQKSVSDLLKNQRNGIVKNELMKLQDGLQGQINSVLQRIDEMDDCIVTHRKSTQEKFAEARVFCDRQLLEEFEVNRQKFTDIDVKLKTLLASAEENIHAKIESASQTAVYASRVAMFSPLRKCLSISKRHIQMSNGSALASYFRKWREYDPAGLLQKARRALKLWSRAGRKIEVKYAFALWLSFVNTQCIRERKAGRLRSIIGMWKQRAIPNRSRLFSIWKRNTILSKYGECMTVKDCTCFDGENSASIHDEYSPSADRSEDSHYAELIAMLNAQKDPHGCLQLVGLSMRSMRERVCRQSFEMESIRGVIGTMQGVVEKNRLEQANMLLSKVDSMESNHKYYRTAMSSHITRLKQEISNCDSKINEKNTEISARLDSIEENMKSLHLRMDTFFEKMERLYGLHGNMLDKMDTIESVQNQHIQNIEDMQSKLSDFDRKSQSEHEKYQSSRDLLDDALEHLSSEIVSCKNSTRFTSKQIDEILLAESTTANLVRTFQQEVQSDLSRIESRLDSSVPLSPLPTDLVQLCLSYEDKVVAEHNKVSKMPIPLDLANSIALLAHTLAHHAVKTSDLNILKMHIKGDDTGVVVDQGLADEGVCLTEFGTDEFERVSRDTILVSFMDSFQEEIEYCRPEAGLVRREARNIFLSKFLDVLDIVLSRLDSVVVEAPSALGRNYDSSSGKGFRSHGACIACNRPLKMRVSRGQALKYVDRPSTSQSVRKQNHTDLVPANSHPMRPCSADPIRHRSEGHHSRIDEPSHSNFVKRGGFKSRLSESMSQEKLVEELIASFPRDVSFPASIKRMSK